MSIDQEVAGESAESGPLQSRSGNVIIKRNEQLVRWNDSETNNEKDSLQHAQRVKFHDCDIFMSACMAGDEAEVDALLVKGASVDTAAMDGLTALHQAVIEGNLAMVSFLLGKGANIDAQDNEGWTPLHAAACCNKVDIVELLCRHGADLSITNGDKDLPIDLCDDEHLQAVFATQYEACRHREEEAMLKDARQWFAMGIVRDRPNTFTGASALHVAAAKGYMSVLKMLLQCNVPLNAVDKDGWTALHAAAHWGETDACQTLVDAHADMTLRSAAGQTCLDVADLQLLPTLQEMRPAVPIHHPVVVQPPPKESSVHRLSMADRAAIAHKDAQNERSEAVKWVLVSGMSLMFRVDSEACSEEADVTRKAKSKRERANRRSTQGVTVEQLDEARKTSIDASLPPVVWKSTALAQQTVVPVNATPARQARRHRIATARPNTGAIEDDDESIDSADNLVAVKKDEHALNYKLLYASERLEKERLARRVAALEGRIVSDMDEVEDGRGALILQLRMDNDRLKQENGALIRVISKLSK